MNAQQLLSRCQYVGTMPTVYLRDAKAGRVSIMTLAERLGTVCPGHILSIDEECALLSFDNNHEIRTSWDNIPALISTLQQTGSWNEVYETHDAMRFFDDIPKSKDAR